MEDLGAGPKGVGERGHADGRDHELLEVRGVQGVLAAVEDVEERDRHDPRTHATEVAIERHLVAGRDRVRRREGDAKDRVGTELALVRRSVEGDQRGVEAGLIGRVRTEELGRDDLADVRHGLQNALAAVDGLVAVAQLHCLVGAGRGAGRDGRPPDRSVDQDDVDLYGRIAARIEDLAGFDQIDCRHESLPAPGRSCSTATPGSSLPSKNSSDAPPPVEMWVILSASPCCSTAATESPPPTTTVAPA